MARRGTEENLINSIVGPGTFFRGHVELNGLLRVDGDFSGSLKSDGRVIIGRAGRADCAIEAGTVVIGGVFRGEIFAAEKVVLLASAVVIGTIRSPRLVAEDGVLLTGLFEITGAVERLVRPDAGARKKDLLLESVRRREASAAVPPGETGRSVGRDADATDLEDTERRAQVDRGEEGRQRAMSEAGGHGGARRGDDEWNA